MNELLVVAGASLAVFLLAALAQAVSGFGSALVAVPLLTLIVDPATAPTVLANLSNIGWFGESIAVDQHLHISRLRTLELQRPMLRATNTGATVVIDHRGRVTKALTPHTRGTLAAAVQAIDGLQRRYFPLAEGQRNPNELPDRPLMR